MNKKKDHFVCECSVNFEITILKISDNNWMQEVEYGKTSFLLWMQYQSFGYFNHHFR